MLKSPSYWVRSIYFLELSLIELLLSILIIIFTITLSIPYIQTALYRAQVSAEGISLAYDIRNQTALYYAQNGELPQNKPQLSSFKMDGRYTKNLQLQDGIVTASLIQPKHFPSLSLSQQQLTFQASTTDSTLPFITWQCGLNTTHESIKTTVPAQYLPYACRVTP